MPVDLDIVQSILNWKNKPLTRQNEDNRKESNIKSNQVEVTNLDIVTGEKEGIVGLSLQVIKSGLFHRTMQKRLKYKWNLMVYELWF